MSDENRDNRGQSPQAEATIPARAERELPVHGAPAGAPRDTPVVAVVLGGGGADDPVARAAGVPCKALAPYRGRALADWVLSALRASKAVRTIVYAGELPAELAELADYRIAAGKLYSDTVGMGIGAALAVAPGHRILIVTADLPWLSGDAIDRFVAASPAGLNYPIIPEEAALAAFPGQKRTFVQLKQGRFTGGNLGLIDPEVVPNLLLLTDRFFRARKNPLALSSLLGLGTTYDLLRGRADLPALEQRVGRLLDAPVKAVVSNDAGLGADIDKPEQLAAD